MGVLGRLTLVFGYICQLFHALNSFLLAFGVKFVKGCVYALLCCERWEHFDKWFSVPLVDDVSVLIFEGQPRFFYNFSNSSLRDEFSYLHTEGGRNALKLLKTWLALAKFISSFRKLAGFRQFAKLLLCESFQFPCLFYSLSDCQISTPLMLQLYHTTKKVSSESFLLLTYSFESDILDIDSNETEVRQ